MKTRKIPLRMCVGCQKMFEKRNLVRLVRTPEGEVLFDPTGKKSGRGVYFCRNQECFNTAMKAKRIQKAFKCEVSMQIFSELSKELNLITVQSKQEDRTTEELADY